MLICARSEGNGIRVRGQNQFAQLGDVFVGDTKIVEMAIEHDGTDLIFEAGAATLADGGNLVEVARVNNFVVDDAYLPSFGAAFLGFPAEISYDPFRVEFNGDPPPNAKKLSAAQEIAHDLYPALDGLLEAIYDLDGANPDTVSARARVVAAQGVLDTALTDVANDLEKGKQQKKARGRVKKAGKKATAVVKKIDKDKPQKKLAKQIAKALVLALGAADVLDPVGP